MSSIMAYKQDLSVCAWNLTPKDADLVQINYRGTKLQGHEGHYVVVKSRHKLWFLILLSLFSSIPFVPETQS